MEIILYELKASRRKNGCRFLMVTGKQEGPHCTIPVQVETSEYNSSHFGRNLKQLFPRQFDHANRNLDQFSFTVVLNTFIKKFSVWYLIKERPEYLSQYCDSLRGGRSGVCIPVGGENFCTNTDRN